MVYVIPVVADCLIGLLSLALSWEVRGKGGIADVVKKFWSCTEPLLRNNVNEQSDYDCRVEKLEKVTGLMLERFTSIRFVSVPELSKLGSFDTEVLR